MKSLFFLILQLIFVTTSNQALAATLSSSGEEVYYEFEITFRSLYEDEINSKEAFEEAKWHSEHVFGMFHAPQYMESFGFPAELVEGFVGSKFPDIIEAESYRKDDDKYTWVRYRAGAKAIVNKIPLNNWLGSKESGSVELPMILDATAIYTDNLEGFKNKRWRQCTDPYYQSPNDFSYFYNPFVCTDLGEEPVGGLVKFNITRMNIDGYKNAKMPLDKIRSDNGNGKVYSIYFVLGFDKNPKQGDSSQKIKKDEGWKLYNKVQEHLINEHGFLKIESLEQLRSEMGDSFNKIELLTPATMNNDWQRRYFGTFVKKIDDRIFIVRTGLFNSDNKISGKPLKSFPLFWKEAWENADFMYYGGHSGDGASMNINNMLENLSAIDIDSIKFKKNKEQVVFIDACSSYAHYQKQYIKKKPESLHLMTYGLVSLFHLAEVTVQTVLDYVLDSKSSPRWMEVMESIEQNQLRPHLDFLYEKKEADRLFKKYKNKDQYPSHLLNVWVPENEKLQ